jgi:predicted ATP-dependent serine protease
MIEGKIKEAQRLGFERIIVPENIKKKINIKKYSIEIVFIASIKALSTFS